ncbi:glycosyltransferase family 39 protein [Vibrio sp. SS-MA-C1-2]|uniref:ArnT family glycosyltransferase n=1 Tax=Vibrio sp. SS-MA-C1-2 TaxID=2908646 RepID=UPI001F3648EB|nr:glycosyltransferase family 39 protein [Vibrio sp. SS-MA-C1-2]UJF17109.1 glycosyltransferase family 39 protein [Vibrio sp. SS-MA-C1-2]
MNQIQHRKPLIVTLFFALVIIFIGISIRPLLPIDETRYVSVAWEMWMNNNWLVPHINGATYAHKPPMMFWLINITWGIFGVSELATRLIVPFLSLINFVLIYHLAKKVYPKNDGVSYSPLLLLGFSGWLLYSSLTMFDLLLTVAVLSYLLSSYQFALTYKSKYVYISGIALGIGLLTKGPAVFIYTLPLFLTYPFWSHTEMINNKTWFKKGFISIGLAVVILLLWVVPAVIMGGAEYRNELLWGQTAGRMLHSFAHARPIYWYLQVLPVLTLPWIVLRGFWQRNTWRLISLGDRYTLIGFASTFVLFSLVSGKQIHYLFPTFPMLAIYISSKLNLQYKFVREYGLIALLLSLSIAMLSSRFWVHYVFTTVSDVHVYEILFIVPLILCWLLYKGEKLGKYYLSILFLSLPLSIMATLATTSPMLYSAYDTKPMSMAVKAEQDKGTEVAYLGDYPDTYQFNGRLTHPLTLVKGQDTMTWLAEHPDAVIVYTVKHKEKIENKAIFIHAFRNRYQALIKASTLYDYLKESD